MSDSDDTTRDRSRERTRDRPPANGGTSATDRLREEQTQTYIFLTGALYAALVVGVAVTALFHDALAPNNMMGVMPPGRWTGVIGAAPLVAGAAGFYTAHDLDGTDAYLASFVGNAAGYLLLYLGFYMIEDTLLDATLGEIEIAMQIGIAAGIGVTGAVFAYAAENYEDWTP